MESFASILTTMMIVFGLIAVGFGCRKKGYTNDTFDGTLSKIVLNVALPAMILNSVLKNSNLPDANTVLVLIAVPAVFLIVLSVLALVIVKVFFKGATKKAQGVYAFTIIFGNTGFIGFPIIESLLGSDAVLYGALFNIPYNIMLFTVGMFLLSSGNEDDSANKLTKIKNALKSLINPANISCFIATALVLFHVTDHGFVGQFCQILGSMVSPCALLIVGSTLAKAPFKRMIDDRRSFIVAFIRLLVTPVIFYYVFGQFIVDPIMLASMTLVVATPVATVGTIMCITHHGDVETMSKCTFLTTSLMLLTLPIIATIII
ncbi:MAG: AEC family transporter [Anaerotardibacter sp.]